jgi:hypothetical protein
MTEKGGRVTDKRKTLGRCPDRHVNIVSLDDLQAPCKRRKGKGEVNDEPVLCGKPMVEWALNGTKGE